MNTVNKSSLVFTLLLLTILISGCKYSFTGASISSETKTVQIDYFPNQSSLIQPSLSQTFTEKLKDRFVSQTSLELVKNNGDISFKGAITNYYSNPTAIQGNEQAALNRLTITVRVNYVNINDSDKNFETSFSRYADYSSSQNLVTVEFALIDEICDQLVNDIFNKSVVNW